ncbi:MAG: hypothetical protein HOB38_04115, partial [Deltaproteobacteria bacterium]|nr:hypothetical protein [Deltaproteobacteria bacterium]
MASTNTLPDLNGIFLLIADQDSSNLRNLKRYLTELGAIVHLAGTMTNAQMIIANKLVHAVLADTEFDQRDGF